jgi:hypothetical protein
MQSYVISEVLGNLSSMEWIIVWAEVVLYLDAHQVLRDTLVICDPGIQRCL